MSLIDIVIAIVCVLIVASVIVLAIFNKKKGKTSCGCDCAHCSGCKNKLNKKTKNQ